MLSAVGGSATTLEIRITDLITGGLVCEERQKSHPFRRILKLTNKGEHLVKTFEILGEMMNPIPIKRSAEPLKNRSNLCLAMLYALGGEIRGGTRLQKLSFLLKKRLNLDKESFYEFSIGKFGPFSAGLSEDMDKIEGTGLVEVTEEVFEPKKLLEDWVICKTYRLTEKGREIARKVFDEMSENVKKELALLKQFNEMLLSDLINHVYSNYPKDSKGD